MVLRNKHYYSGLKIFYIMILPEQEEEKVGLMVILAMKDRKKEGQYKFCASCYQKSSLLTP